MNVGREEVENSFKLELSSLKSLEALKPGVHFPELPCGYGTLKSERGSCITAQSVSTQIRKKLLPSTLLKTKES